MCYKDSKSTITAQLCPTSHEYLFDCDHDDYYSTDPPAGSYLAMHWNAADSSWLDHSDNTT
jgi:hypothetical protein